VRENGRASRQRRENVNADLPIEPMEMERKLRVIIF
jgi:hypothetical protein